MIRAAFSRRRRKSDANQREIVSALRTAGYTVQVLHRVGDGFPDLLAANPLDKLNILIEVKAPGKSLTPSESKFFSEWPGLSIMAESGEQALKQLAQLRAAYRSRR